MARPVIPASQGIVKGSATSIPEELLNRNRANYNWDEFEVGDHKTFPMDEFPKARASATAFGRGTKTRAPRRFGSRTVTVGEGDKAVKTGEVWRLADPTPTPVTASTNNREETK